MNKKYLIIGIVLAIVIISMGIVFLKLMSPVLIEETVVLSTGDVKEYPIQLSHGGELYIQISVSGAVIEWQFATKESYERGTCGFELCSESRPDYVSKWALAGVPYVLFVRSGNQYWETEVSIVKVKVSTEPILQPQ